MPAKLSTPPTTVAEVQSLLATEIVRTNPDRFKLQYLTRLLDSFEAQEKDAETAASKSLPAVVAERDAALAKVSELEPIAAKVAELETFKATNDEWRAEQVRVLTEEANKQRWAAERAENNAKSALKEAQLQFGARGQQILLDFVERLIEQFSIPEPAPETLPAGISPLVLTLWGNSAIRSQLMMVYSRSFPEPSEAYRQTLLQLLKTTLPLQNFAGMEPPAPVEHLREKIEVLRSLGQKWPGVLADIEREFEQMQVQRQAEYLRNHNAQMSALEHDEALRGAGRTPLGQQAPVSSVPISEHLPGCPCRACGGSGHIEGNWDGFIPADPTMGAPLPTKREEEER